MNLVLKLLFGSLPPLDGCGYLGRQGRNLLLSHILILARDHNLVSQNRDPLGHSGRLLMGGCQQRSFLLGHPLFLGSADPCHHGSRLRSSHLLPKLHLLDHVLS
jgi:hypothetical protein